MKLSLLVLTAGKQEGKKLEIKAFPFLVGRDAQCHLRPASPLISKKHCAFLLRDNRLFLQDFDSTNGSLVNGEPIKGEVELKDKDRVKIGPIEFQILMEVPATIPVAAQPTVKKPTGATVKKPAPVAAATPSTDTGETVNEDSTTTRESASGEDDIAAMLLNLADDTDTSSPAVDGNAIPDGSTVMEMKLPPEVLEAAEKSKHQKAKEAQASTSQAARDILSKYMRRPRG